MRSRVLPFAILAAAGVAACSDTLGPEPYPDIEVPIERVALSVGFTHSCAIAIDGRTYCWGARLGAAGPGLDLEPATVADDRAFVAISAGSFHTCGAADDGTAYCWGGNPGGALGTGDTDPRASPHAVAGGHRFAVLRGGGTHSCGVATNGEVFCWGANRVRQLGVATSEQCDLGSREGPESCSTVPVRAATSLRFNMLSAGSNHTCATTPVGDAHCWGLNRSGELGVVDAPLTSFAVVGGNVSFASLSAGAIHTCGTTAAAQAYCWGNNNWGQLGGTSAETCSFSSPCSTAPKLIDSGLTFRTVTAGWQHTCGLTLTGEAYCWGANSRGELGTGAPVGFPVTSYPTPVAVAGGLTFARLSASESHTCGITTAGHAYCWGDNQYGQLGDGTTTSSNVPVPVRGGITFRTD